MFKKAPFISYAEFLNFVRISKAYMCNSCKCERCDMI